MKNLFLIFARKVKTLRFICVFNISLLFFMLANLNRVFNKLIRVLVSPGIYMKNFGLFCFYTSYNKLLLVDLNNQHLNCELSTLRSDQQNTL